MKNLLLLAGLAMLVISCSQNKQTTTYKEAEDVHRYSTVYEGNRIIKYEKEAVSEEMEEPSVPNYAVVETAVNVPKPAIQPLPDVVRKPLDASTTNATDKSNKSLLEHIKSSFQIKVGRDEKTQSTNAESGPKFGIIGFSLIMVAIVLFIVVLVLYLSPSTIWEFVWPQFIVLILSLISIAAFIVGTIFSIIGVAKPKSNADLVLGIIGLSISGLLLFIFLIF